MRPHLAGLGHEDSLLVFHIVTSIDSLRVRRGRKNPSDECARDTNNVDNLSACRQIKVDFDETSLEASWQATRFKASSSGDAPHYQGSISAMLAEAGIRATSKINRLRQA